MAFFDWLRRKIDGVVMPVSLVEWGAAQGLSREEIEVLIGENCIAYRYEDGDYSLTDGAGAVLDRLREGKLLREVLIYSAGNPERIGSTMSGTTILRPVDPGPNTFEYYRPGQEVTDIVVGPEIPDSEHLKCLIAESMKFNTGPEIPVKSPIMGKGWRIPTYAVPPEPLYPDAERGVFMTKEEAEDKRAWVDGDVLLRRPDEKRHGLITNAAVTGYEQPAPTDPAVVEYNWRYQEILREREMVGATQVDQQILSLLREAIALIVSLEERVKRLEGKS
jgi:hypothetical protein